MKWLLLVLALLLAFTEAQAQMVVRPPPVNLRPWGGGARVWVRPGTAPSQRFRLVERPGPSMSSPVAEAVPGWAARATGPSSIGRADAAPGRIFQSPSLRTQAQWFGRQGLNSVCAAGSACPRSDWRPSGEYGRGASAAPSRQEMRPGAPPVVYEAFSVRCRVAGCGATSQAVVGTDGTYRVQSARPATLARSAVQTERSGNNDPQASPQPLSPQTRDKAQRLAETARRR